MSSIISNNIVVAIQQIVEEIFEDSSSSDEEEFLAVGETYQEKDTVVLRRVQNYVNVVHLYSDPQFQSHFR